MRYLPLLAVLVGLSSACTTDNILPDRRPDYRQARLGSSLELPPDLNAVTEQDRLVIPDLNTTGDARLSEFGQRQATTLASAGATVLPEADGMEIYSDGDRHWLEAQADPATLWPRIEEFWAGTGLELQRADPRIGVMETTWAENRADIPEGPIRSLLGSVMDFAYSSPTRDKFRLRLARVDGGSEVYITHYGMEEVVQGTGRQSEGTIWQIRPRDPELEAEMLRRLMVYLGVPEGQAEAELAAPETPRELRARLVELGEGAEALLVAEPYHRVWRRVGLALDSNGFLVQEQDREQGLYVAEYNDPRQEAQDDSWLSRLAFWRDDPPPQGSRHRVRVGDRGDQTLVMVYNAQGQPDTSDTARALLDVLRRTLE